MKPLRLSFCAALVAAACGTAVSLLGTEAELTAEKVAPEALVRHAASGMLEAHVDFVEAARLAAGTVWTRASEAERRQLAAAFRPMLLRAYVGALQAQGEGQAPLAVEYALHRRGGEWKIYDIRVDGESLVAACRPLFERIAQAEGIGGLIQRMKGSDRGQQPVVAA
jgi:ABC-type transporter MlaC component